MRGDDVVGSDEGDDGDVVAVVGGHFGVEEFCCFFAVGVFFLVDLFVSFGSCFEWSDDGVFVLLELWYVSVSVVLCDVNVDGVEFFGDDVIVSF